MRRKPVRWLAVLGCLAAPVGRAQSVTNMAVLRGLSPVTVLAQTAAGRAALAANYSVTGGIQMGTLRQPTLLPFAAQQQQALKDAFISDGNLADLADGLGTTLGAAYTARAHYLDQTRWTNLTPAVAGVIAYANATTAMDSASGKYFFANATTDGKTPVSAEAMAILKSVNGQTDFFGKAYGRPAGSANADAYGNSRPFQTEPTLAPIAGPDYLNVPADNVVYNRGPMMNLIDSPSFPSGHTTYGYMGSLMLAMLVPERYAQMMARAAEYGNDRIIFGAHYAMDILGGRTLAMYDLAHLLANDPKYVGRTLNQAPVIKDFQASVEAARNEVKQALEAACGKTMAACASEDIGRLSSPAGNEALCAATLTYSLPVVYPERVGQLEDIGKLAPEAGYLLKIAFPWLSLEAANRILTETEGPGGGFLDNGSSFGVYSRLNLYAAALRAGKKRDSTSDK